ncbi:hypothetical protein SprV_0100218100 [Sparganum proliferum]
MTVKCIMMHYPRFHLKGSADVEIVEFAGTTFEASTNQLEKKLRETLRLLALCICHAAFLSASHSLSIRCWDARGLSLASRVLEANQRCPLSDWLADAETTEGAHTRWDTTARSRTQTTACCSALAATAYRALVQVLIMDNSPPEVQHILAPSFGTLSATQLTQMANRLMEMHGFSKPSISALSAPSAPPASPISQLEIDLTKLADDKASLQKQAASPSSRSHSKPSTPHIRSSNSVRPNTAATCWYHTTFGVKARRCISPCSFTSKQSRRVKPVNPKVCAANPPDGFNTGRTFYVRDTKSGRRFLVDTGAQISVVPPTAADRRFPSPGLHLQAANCSPIPTFGILSLTLNTGLRRSFTWIFLIADVPHAILGSDFLAEFDLLVDCRRARLLDRTTGLFVRGLTPFTAPTNLSLLDTDIASPFRQLLLSHPNIINPQFRSGEVQHGVVHHIRTSGPPVFARQRRLAPERFQVAKAEF